MEGGVQKSLSLIQKNMDIFNFLNYQKPTGEIVTLKVKAEAEASQSG